MLRTGISFCSFGFHQKKRDIRAEIQESRLMHMFISGAEEATTRLQQQDSGTTLIVSLGVAGSLALQSRQEQRLKTRMKYQQQNRILILPQPVESSYFANHKGKCPRAYFCHYKSWAVRTTVEVVTLLDNHLVLRFRPGHYHVHLLLYLPVPADWAIRYGSWNAG